MNLLLFSKDMLKFPNDYDEDKPLINVTSILLAIYKTNPNDDKLE